jgi:hypothetical protein
MNGFAVAAIYVACVWLALRALRRHGPSDRNH